MKLFYFESGMGCGIRLGRNENSAYEAILREVGTYQGVSLVREATEADKANVRAMGGYVPEEPKKRSK